MDQNVRELTETIARHFEGASIDGNVVDTGVAGLHISCEINRIDERPNYVFVNFFFNIWGGEFGDEKIFISASGSNFRGLCSQRELGNFSRKVSVFC